MVDQSNSIPEEDLVLLAEGELFGKEKQELIEKVDANSDWKRLALILLQSQAIRTGMSRMETSLPEQEGHFTESAITEKQKLSVSDSLRVVGNARPSKLAGLGKLAICLGLVFMMGGIFGLFVRSQITDASGNRTDTAKGNQADKTLETRQSLNKPTQDKQPIVNDPGMLAQLNRVIESTGVKDSKLIAFVNIEKNSQRQVYPLIESQELSRQIELSGKPSLPEKVLTQMRKSGWRVQANQQFVSVHLPNGQSRIFPVGMLNYEFVGNPVF